MSDTFEIPALSINETDEKLDEDWNKTIATTINEQIKEAVYTQSELDAAIENACCEQRKRDVMYMLKSILDAGLTEHEAKHVTLIDKIQNAAKEAIMNASSPDRGE